MILEPLVVGMLQTNCYLLGDPETGRAVVIDPGGDSERIVARLRKHGLTLEAILLTHAHFDHVLDAWTLKEELGGEIYLHPEDKSLLNNRSVGLGAVFSSAAQKPKGEVDRWIREGDELAFGGIRLHVLETPGHTPGHVSFHCPEARCIFVGDTLFAGSIGRTDFPGGSYDRLIRSVREKIFVLDGETAVYTGHGPETTVAREMRTNPFFS